MNLPPMALEVTPEGLVIPVEAPPCGHLLDIPSRHVHLYCDRPAGHDGKHRAIIQLTPPQAVNWCDDGCSQPCTPVMAWLRELRWPSG